MRHSASPRKLNSSRFLRNCCPSCGSEEVWRTHRRTLYDWILGGLGFRPYRCGECQRRFHALPALRSLALTSKDRRALALRRHAGSSGVIG